jgi:hypothetical protein
MLKEFDRFVADDQVRVSEDGDSRLYTYRGRPWRLHWWRGEGPPPEAVRGDTVLAERALPATVLADYRARGASWLDLATKTRCEDGSPLAEELALFLGRYGIRLVRDG